MANYGGLGGIWDGRDLDPEDKFEAAVNRCLGERLRVDEDLCKALWGSLANRDWVHENGDTAGYSFRAAGDLVAAIRGNGMYMDWYCSAPDGVLNPDIEAAMATEGWSSPDSND